jgi:hypothetical protein
MTAHNNDDWMQNDKVTFHIPGDNIVDSVSLKAVYDKMKLRCTNFNQMYARKAPDFDLPTFEFNKFKDPVFILEKFGYIFFNKREYQFLYSILSEMSLTKIVANRKILLLSAITYFHIGQSIEGDYFLRKCEAFLDEYNNDEKELLQISKLVADFSLGKITRMMYYEKLKALKSNLKGVLNSIYISLQILFMELLNTSIYDDGTSIEEAFTEIEAIQAKIDSIEAPEETRYFYLLEIVSFTHEIGIRQLLRVTARMMIQKRMLGNSPLNERLDNAKLLYSLIVRPKKLLRLIGEYSKRTNNAYMQAMVLFKRTYMFYSLVLQSLMSAYANGTSIENFKESHTPELFRQTYNDILEAYNIFRQRRDLSNAYKCLSLSFEINCLFSFIHNKKNIDDKVHKQAILALESLEKDLNLNEPYSILTEKTLIDLIKRKEENIFNGYSSLSSVEEKYQMANMVIKSIGLPPERVQNIISEINFMQKAKDAVNLKYFDVLQNLSHTKRKETLYKEVPRYVIRCKNCHYETAESDDLDTLLACLRAEHCHFCL